MSNVFEDFKDKWDGIIKIDNMLTEDDLNPEMVEYVKSACNDVAECIDGSKISVEIGEVLKFFGSVDIVGKSLVVTNPKKLAFIIKNANNYEIYNRSDDTIYMSIGYYGMLKMSPGNKTIVELTKDQLDLEEWQIEELSFDQKAKYADIILEKYNEESEGLYKRTYDLDDGRYIIQFAMSTSYDLELDFLNLIAMCDRFVVRQTEETNQVEEGDVAEFEFTFKR